MVRKGAIRWRNGRRIKKCQSFRFGIKSCRIAPASAHEKEAPGEGHELHASCAERIVLATGCEGRRSALRRSPFRAASPQTCLCAPVPLLAFALDGIEHIPIRIDGFKKHVESPQPRHMFQHFIRLLVQRPAQVLVMAQRQ